MIIKSKAERIQQEFGMDIVTLLMILSILNNIYKLWLFCNNKPEDLDSIKKIGIFNGLRIKKIICENTPDEMTPEQRHDLYKLIVGKISGLTESEFQQLKEEGPDYD